MLIAISIMILFFGFYPNTKADPITIYVYPGESIQDTIDTANSGDTVFVYNGTYYENLFIDKTINLVGENKNTTIIDAGGNGNAMMIYDAYNLSISGFTIQNSNGLIMQGLLIWDASYNEVFDNIFKNNYIGINLKIDSFENIIHHNYFINNIYNAIDYTECENQWDDGLEGNFWDDYTGSGPYIISGPYGCQDNYPLIVQPGPNNPPNIPDNPTPSNGKTSVNINQDFYWSGEDPDDDPVKYDVYFGDTLPPVKKSSNQSAKTFNPGIMEYSTTYYWQIVSWDNHGASSSGPIWSFTTGAQSSGGGGGDGGGGSIIIPNLEPTANASASDSSGFINTPIVFNASYSIDSDGDIVYYTWDFGDGSYGYGIFITHIYAEAGVYDVKLTVTDDGDMTDTDSFSVVIREQNSPPSIPQINGPETGKQNVEYNFSVYSTDVDNDNIQYVFNWGDGQTDETDFLANGTIYVREHQWTNAGVFKINAFAIDNKYTSSASAVFDILIDAIYCGNLGYLIDENSDDTYDLFYSNKTGVKTSTQQQDDGSYLLNYDEDSNWDYIYDIQNNIYSVYSETSADIFKDVNIWLFALIIIVILAILIVVILIRKKPKEVIEKQRTEEPQVEEPRVEEQKIEEPKPEAVKTEEPVGTQPEAVVSKVEEPITEEPQVEEPKTMEQKIEDLISEKEKVEEPTVEEEKTEEIKTEEPQMEKPEIEEEKTEEQKIEEPEPREPETKEPESEKPQVEEKIAEEQKIEESKLEEIKTEEPEVKEPEEEKIKEPKTMETEETQEPEIRESEPEVQKVEEKETMESEMEEPEVEEPKTEEPQVEEKMAEEHKIEDEKTEEPEVKETEEVKTEESKVEEQKTEEQKVEEPEVRESEPKETDESKIEEKETEEEKPEEQKPEEPEVKEPEEQKPEEQKTEESKMEEPKVEEPKIEEPQVEEKMAEEQKIEEPKPVETETKEPEAIESKQEEPKTEEPKPEEQKTEEEKAEESKVKKPKPSGSEDEEQKT